MFKWPGGEGLSLWGRACLVGEGLLSAPAKVREEVYLSKAASASAAPVPTKGTPADSSRAWMPPSSPYLPWSAGKAMSQVACRWAAKSSRDGMSSAVVESLKSKSDGVLEYICALVMAHARRDWSM